RSSPANSRSRTRGRESFRRFGTFPQGVGNRFRGRAGTDTSGISALAWRTGVVGRPAWANQAWGRPTATPYPVDFARPETIPDRLCKPETIPAPSLGCHTHCRPLPRLSHALRLARLTGMRTERAVLAGIVLIHLILSMIHGSAHAGARVALPVAGTLFVYL